MTIHSYITEGIASQPRIENRIELPLKWEFVIPFDSASYYSGPPNSAHIQLIHSSTNTESDVTTNANNSNIGVGVTISISIPLLILVEVNWSDEKEDFKSHPIGSDQHINAHAETSQSNYTDFDRRLLTAYFSLTCMDVSYIQAQPVPAKRVYLTDLLTIHISQS